MLILWSLMIVGEWYVATLALRRTRSTYPWFTSLVCFMAVKSLALLYIRMTLPPQDYFYPYYYSDLAVSFLQLGSTVEVFGTLFRPFWTIPKRSLVTLTLITFTGLCLIAKASTVWQVNHDNGDMALFRNIDRLVSCSVAIVLVAVLMFSKHFDMPYRTRVKGIASGLCVMSVTSITMALALSQFGNVSKISFAYVPLVAHYGTLTVWIYFISRKEAMVAVLGSNELEEVRKLLNQFKLALSYTPTSCGLTTRKPMGRVMGEQTAKTVNHR